MFVVVVAGIATWFAQSQDARDRMGGVPRLDNPENNVRKSDRDREGNVRRTYDKDGGFSEKHAGFRVKVAPDGRVRFEDRNARASGLGAGFDLTEWIMRMHGEDPYRFQKHKFLDQTADERTRMARADSKERLRRALDDLPHLLSAVAESAALGAAGRRSIVFQLWDECAEKGDVEIVTAARQARAIIEGFVRARMPEGSGAAFSVADLESLNARRKSSAPFAPYDRPMLPSALPGPAPGAPGSAPVAPRP